MYDSRSRCIGLTSGVLGDILYSSQAAFVKSICCRSEENPCGTGGVERVILRIGPEQPGLFPMPLDTPGARYYMPRITEYQVIDLRLQADGTVTAAPSTPDPFAGKETAIKPRKGDDPMCEPTTSNVDAGGRSTGPGSQ
jgi:hypothetical protein